MDFKWSWAGHLSRHGDDRASKVVTEWRPRTEKRSVGRPVARWANDIVAIAGIPWMRQAQNVERHKQIAIYTQQWMKTQLFIFHYGTQNSSNIHTHLVIRVCTTQYFNERVFYCIGTLLEFVLRSAWIQIFVVRCRYWIQYSMRDRL